MSYQIRVRRDEYGEGSNCIELKLPDQEIMILTERDVPEDYEDGEESTCLYYATERIAYLEGVLREVLSQIDGNLHATARDIVNGNAGGNAVYDDCEKMESLIHKALGGDDVRS